MDIHEDYEPDKSEKITRFGCGALFGILVGIGLVIRFAIASFGLVVGVILGAILVCGFLALKHGDEFWYSLKNWW